MRTCHLPIRRLLAAMSGLAMCIAAGTSQGAMQDLDDAALQAVAGKDGISIVLSNNFGFRMLDIPATLTTPLVSNGIQLIAPRRTLLSAGNYLDFDKEYTQFSDLSFQATDFAPLSDPILLDLFKLGNGKTALQLSLPANTGGTGSLDVGVTLSTYAHQEFDNNLNPATFQAPVLSTIGRLSLNHVVQYGTNLQVVPMNDGYGFAMDTELNIGSVTLSPFFSKDPLTGIVTTDPNETWTASNVKLCGMLDSNNSCVAGTRFHLGDAVAGPIVLRSEQVAGVPTVSLTMGDVTIQARSTSAALIGGSISVDDLSVSSNRCAAGSCDFGRQSIGDIKIYSMRVRFKDL